MIMTIENKRRELFEAWYLTTSPATDFNVARDTSGQYWDFGIRRSWLGFNAALDAVAIELPAGSACQDMLSTEVVQAIDDCRASIESTCLGLKVLP